MDFETRIYPQLLCLNNSLPSRGEAGGLADNFVGLAADSNATVEQQDQAKCVTV